MLEMIDENMEITSRDKHSVVNWLEKQTEVLLCDIQSEEFWKFLMDPLCDPASLRRFVRQVYLEIVGYQPDVIKAAISAIGQMPRSMNPRVVKAMLLHQGDEFDHGEMALRDLLGLGGDENSIRNARMSPEAFAIAGCWWMISHSRDPFMYLGALYLFEGLTPTVTGLVKQRLIAKGFTGRSLEYIEFHSTEDIKHANLVHHLISNVAENYPASVDSIKYGFDCFRALYPIPLWTAAYVRSQRSQ